MAQQIQRNLEKEGIYLNKWWSGVNNNRSPLFVPISAMGVQLIERQDTLWDGLNWEVSPKMTLRRRYGFSKFSSAQFGSSSYPLKYKTFKNNSGTIWPMVDCPDKVYTFTSSTITAVFTKSTTKQTSMEKWADWLYGCDGTSTWKWNGTTRENWGITAPVWTPGLSYGAGALSPTVGYTYVCVYKNSSTGHISTASPHSANTGPQTSKNITISYTASGDSQVDKIDIYRTADGGSVFYYLATVNNGSSSYTDSTADSGLNDDLIAPLAHSNDPVPAGATLIANYAGRLWVAVGNKIYFSGGPDTTNGVGAESWPPANNFPCPGQVKAMVATSQGLLIFTDDDAYVISGTNFNSFTVPLPWQQNFGVKSQNSICQDGDLLFIMTSRGQLFSIQVGSGLQEIGFPIATYLAAMNPNNVHLTLHRSGADEGVFVSDGSTNLWRYSVSMAVWSPVAQPVGGVGVVDSIEVADSSWRLMMGRTAGSGYILQRDTTLFTDDGTSFTGFVDVGSFIVSPPGQTAKVENVLIQTAAAGTFPTVGVLVNEVSGTFITLPNPVNDPTRTSGAPSTTVIQKRHQMRSAQTPIAYGEICNMRVKVSFIAENAANELLGLGLL